MAIKLAVAGVCGRMGRRIFDLASMDKDFELVLALEKKGIAAIGKEIGKLKISSNPDGIFIADVLIDFTTPEATMEHLQYALRYKKPIVVGTTGFGPEQIQKIEEAANVIAVVFSPNMAVGVNILFELLPLLARRLGSDYKIEIVEAHHQAKRDAPSGTAKKFASILEEATHTKIPVHAIRLGDIVGDHTIIFCGNSERIEIRHQAHSRDIFAWGALKAARWVVTQRPGLYSMQDVLKEG